MTTTKLVFVDTNVLIYVRDKATEEKRHVASSWLRTLSETSRGRVNLQVLNEFTRYILRKEPRRPLDEVRAEVAAFSAWGDRPVEARDVDRAWEVRRASGFQWFDCLLLASASNDGCDVFLSEDMRDGARFGRLTIVDPFRHDPDHVL